MSVLIVGLVGFALYRPDPSGPAGPATASPVITTDPDPDPTPTARAAPPEPTPGVPWMPSPPSDRLVQAPAPSSPTPTTMDSPVSTRHPSRSHFATVRDGERLADVARRIYGDETAAETLWQANRDQLPNPDSPLRTGMPLRTP